MIAEERTQTYDECREILSRRLDEAAPGRIQLLTGPRQVGKTSLLLEVRKERGDEANYVALDGPDAALPGFWERTWQKAEQQAKRGGRAILLLDELPSLPDWPTLLKARWDRLRAEGIPLHVVASGSSSMRVAAGSRESLAGRFERLTLGHWNAATLARRFDMETDHAVDTLVRHGAFPGAVEYLSDPGRWRDYILHAILEPALGRDVLALQAIRKPALLRQVFGAAVASPAQVVSLQKLQGQLRDRGALETLAQYLELLHQAYLVAPLAKYSGSRLRRRAAPPKLVLLSNAFLAVTDPEGPPTRANDPTRFGRWVENACLAHAVNAGQQVTYWREEPLEVDAVFEGSWGRWAVEVKTGPFTGRDLRGLLEFCRRYPDFTPLVLGDGNLDAARRIGVLAMGWREFLTGGPGASS